uniref:Uncharacterized protein n=1 Tax=Kwoniella pini CBS 10737 TaxID=1296096 RepID=A0A1B9I6L1_9TREE|nr:uncharacterized protein I206_03228 [Kwoniella pini CBS 10737]OCF51162.1 hypothetical protein I206_03228 [Kwoniella pini CBS 10737]
MGNDQSRSTNSGGNDSTEERPPNYYELLQVDEDATADEIKRSYRKLALVNHPDKNPHRIEEATKLFADLQQAYEILSDPNERAFYDNHRNVPVAATDDDIFDHVRSGDKATNDPKSKLNKRRQGDPGVRLEQLMRFFDPKLARKMDDTNEGFYSVYRTLFALLASDEDLHISPDSPSLAYPSFGDSTTSYAPAQGTTRAEKDSQIWVRDFYLVWTEFVTEKRFDWVAKWDIERAESRDIRRLMEKENKKVRDDYRKEYNDTVRQLVSFIQHRDPRYKAHQAKIAKEKAIAKSSNVKSGSSTPLGAGSGIDSDAARKRHEERMRSAAQYEEQSWQKLDGRQSDEEDLEEDEDTEEQENGDGTGVRLDDGMGGEFFECVACSKTFASEASWANHERSKKHKQAVWRLKKEMMAEAKANGESRNVSDEDDDIEQKEIFEDAQVDTPPSVEASEKAEAEVAKSKDIEIDALEDELVDLALEESENVEYSSRKSKKKAKRSKNIPTPQHLLDPDPESLPRTPDEFTSPSTPIPDDDLKSDAEEEGSERPSEMSKKDKRRAKEARKKAEEENRKLALKEARKAAKKGQSSIHDTRAEQEEKLSKDKDDGFSMPKQKGKGKGKAKVDVVDEFAEEKVAKVVEGIKEKKEKMLEKWGENWSDLINKLQGILASSPAPDGIGVLCLGIGKPFSERTAQIQLALILELATSLNCAAINIEAFDPVSDEGDKKVLQAFGITHLEQNLTGKHVLSPTKSYILYLPHAPKQLYESLLQTNFSPALGNKPGRILLGNDLAEYIPGFVRGTADEKQTSGQGDGEGEFVKAKKKRKGKGDGPKEVPDGVLQRLVPHMTIIHFNDALPETNLPGFARAFLSLAFQWLESDKLDKIDWKKELPDIEWSGGEVIA